MLIDFKFTNYKSFKDTAELNLTASRVTEYPHHIVQTAGEKVLRTAAVYGANASGKTNLHEALKYMQYYVLNSFAFGENNTAAKKNPQWLPAPFLFNTKSITADTTFEIWFTIPKDTKEHEYNYGFSLNSGKVTEEWLSTKTKTGRNYKPVFTRETGKETVFEKQLEKYKDNINISLNDETLIVSLGSRLKADLLVTIYNWFGTLVFLNFGNPVENILMSYQLPDSFIQNAEFRKKAVEYINTFDTSIKDFTLEKVLTQGGTESYQLYAMHKNQETGETIPILFDMESAGTQKMLALYFPLQTVLNTGGALIIDEFNDRLHPLLVRNFIQTFIDPKRNPNNAQLIFTTHDVWHLSSKLFRRDEIWFCEKAADETSSLYSLVDIKGENDAKIRNDENILKNYLAGKYGAIPDLHKISLAEEHA